MDTRTSQMEGEGPLYRLVALGFLTRTKVNFLCLRVKHVFLLGAIKGELTAS